jgi:hypothetical protein
MDRELFLDRLLRATQQTCEFAMQFVLDALPSKYAHWVLLNCSYDRNPLMDGEIAYPDDVLKHGKRVGPLMAGAVVSLLWRGRTVPEWIDISVWEADEHVTYPELMCCGRFTADPQRLYIVGPMFPHLASRGRPFRHD